MSEIVPSGATNPPATTAVPGAAADLDRFEQAIRVELGRVGLPSDQVFVRVSERQAMLSNMGTVLANLNDEVLGRSYYISKMIAAAAVGLFDAALNYLWDELVNELRRRVVGFDLAYFYDIAAGGSDLRKHLKTDDDLTKIDDSSLLRAALEIGMLTEVGYKRLDFIRYMRNHASAAHPNQVTLSGLELASWLQTVITEVINTPPDTVTATTGKLLRNIKLARLDPPEIDASAAFFDQLPPDRAATLANGLFGLYTDPDSTAVIDDNVRTLWPRLWPFVSEETRSTYGLRLARAQANAEVDWAKAARELIELVNGTAYLTPETRAVEIATALDTLEAAHRGLDNFYNEAAPAQRLLDLVGKHGDIPAPVRGRYVRVVAELFIGNGYGVSWAADPLYQEMIQRFSPSDAGVALRMFDDVVFSSLLGSAVSENRWEKLLDLLDPKLTSNTDRKLMAAIRDFSGTPDKLRLDSSIAKLSSTRP
ncbi:hypothetical protein ABQF35_11135 [Mycobacterium syngnathidarum]